MNKGDITLEQGVFLVNDNIYDFSDGFLNFLTNPNVTYGDIEEDNNKIKRFLFDIRYDVGKGDKKSCRYRTIKSILLGKDGVFGRGSNSICEAGSLIDIREAGSQINPNSLVERLELLILETTAGHDGLFDKMLKISKQLFSMKIIKKEPLDKFVFNYRKKIMVEKQQFTTKAKQQLLAREVFSPQITKLRKERKKPLYKDETWSVDLLDKSSLSKYNNNYKFIFTVIDIFSKYAWAFPLKKKSGLSITNGFKIVLGEHPQGGSESRKSEKLWLYRGSEFYNRTTKSLLKEYETTVFYIQ